MEKSGIPSWPELERPRERLIDQGAEVLSDAQLLAIMIRMGKKGQTAMDIAFRLLEHFNGLKGVAGATVVELCQIGGIGPSKAAQILGAIEIGKRVVSNKRSMKGKFLSSKEIYSYFFPEYSSLKVEIFKVVLLNTKNQLIHGVEISKGSLNQTIVHPREVFNKAIKNSAASLILIHNHPSGDPAPSQEDIALTQTLVKSGQLLGIPVLDHIIIGNGDYYSFADNQALIEK
ncbi:MAG: DNA repair protein RadC [Nitrospirae bacterium]|nr:DNA repair protein RadC [Nitrospirota bacterium]